MGMYCNIRAIRLVESESESVSLVGAYLAWHGDAHFRSRKDEGFLEKVNNCWIIRQGQKDLQMQALLQI